jgi:hypothetical protein
LFHRKKTFITKKLYNMKKILILLVMLGGYCSSYAFLTQSTWRWRNNDGNETTATWRAAQNTATVYNNYDSVLRLRVEVYNNNSGNPIQVEDSLQYTTTPAVAGSWVNILRDDLTRAFVMAGPSVNGTIVQDTPTTSQITGTAYPYTAGKLMVDSTVAKGVFIPASTRTEIEWAIKGTPATLTNTTYYFRHWGATSNNLPPGVTYPSLVTAATLPVKLTAFSVKSDGKKVTLNWTTESEQNNDRFDVEKSTDGSHWRNIATVKGKGSSNQPQNYTSYDDQPVTGTNYYRLKQVDFDGKFTISDVRSLKFGNSKNVLVSISPNPVSDVVNFKLAGTAATNVVAIFSDANGKIIHHQKFVNVQAGTLNQLNLRQKPTAGMYILKLQGEGVSESIKIVVQ